VSALGNAIAFNTSLDPVAAVRALNAKLSRVWAWAALQVPPDFNPHRARERWYRYDLSRNHDIEKLQSVLSLFQGQHDFRNFTRDRTRTVLRIDQARAIRDGDSVALDFRAPSFRWNLVRRLVSAAVRVDSDVVSLRQVASALEGASRSDLGLAPPEGLTLMDVFFDLEFQRVTDPTTRDRVRQLRIGRLRSLRFVEAVAGRLEGSHLSQDVQGTSP
jgi:tRNA pseudouridine38-40 synthase